MVKWGTSHGAVTAWLRVCTVSLFGLFGLASVGACSPLRRTAEFRLVLRLGERFAACAACTAQL